MFTLVIKASFPFIFTQLQCWTVLFHKCKHLLRICVEWKNLFYTSRVLISISSKHKVLLIHVHFSIRSRLKMESIYFINLILIFALNVCFLFSGICFNSVVIFSFWRSVQLRKKLCYFMIMVLSCCDLLAVLTNNPLSAVVAMTWLTEEPNLKDGWTDTSMLLTNIFPAFSLFALLVMNFDRYLATSYPLFHRTSVTKGRLLTLLAIMIIVDVILAVMSLSLSLISYQVKILINFIVLAPPMLFINYKLFLVVRKSRSKKRVSPELRKRFSLKNISSCLLVVACFVTITIPAFVYIGLRINSPGTELTLDNANLAAFWAKTISTMNCTFNCLIFYWKDKALRTEGLKVLKSMKISRLFQS